MKKHLLLIIFLTLPLFSETLEFSGSYQSISLNNKNCIYSGVINTKRIKVYTKESCPMISLDNQQISSTRFSSTLGEIKQKFYCVVGENSIFDKYITYEGKCTIK